MTDSVDDTKACPFCAETIKAAAIVCRHCGRDLPALPVAWAEISSDDRALADKHGIRWADDRWVYAGSYFKLLTDAIQFAEANPGQREASPSVQPPTRPTKWWVWPIGAVGLFLLWAILRTPSPEENAKHQARFAIEHCWDEQKRKSHDASTAQFVAGACEELERRFKARYGVNP